MFAETIEHVEERPHGVEASFARSAAVLQWREDRGIALDAVERPKSDDIEETLRLHPELFEFAHQVRRSNGRGRPDELATGAVLTYVLHRTHREHRELAQAFYDGLRSGIGLEEKNPLLRLRKTLYAKRVGPNRSTRYESVHILLDGWRDYVAWRSASH